MKKFKYIIALFAIFICNQTFAGEIDLGTGKIITDDNYLQYDNGVFLGKKQLDEEKGKKVRYGNYLINLYKNKNIDFLKEVSTNSSYYYGYDISKFYYENSYYSIKTNINSNITRITDFEGNNLTFSGTGGDIKIYNISFFDYLRNDDTNSRYYNFKYGNNYSYNAKPINIFFENGDNLSLDFKFNIPQISSDNEIYTFSGVNYITNNDGYNIKSDVLFDGNIYFGGIENTLSQDGKNINFNIDFNGSILFNKNVYINNQNTLINLFSYNNYDYFKYNYGIINVNSSLCGKNNMIESEIYNGYNYVELRTGYVNYKSKNYENFEINDFNIELQKYDGTKFNIYTDYSAEKSINIYSTKQIINGVSDGIYKIKVTDIKGNLSGNETIDSYCFDKFNKKNTLSSISDINNVIVKNGKFYKLDDLYFLDNYNNFKLNYYTNNKNIFNSIEINLYSSTGGLLYNANNDIIKTYDQSNRDRFEDIVNNVIRNNPDITLEVKYTYFEGQTPLTYKKSTKKTYVNNIEDMYNGSGVIYTFYDLKEYLLLDTDPTGVTSWAYNSNYEDLINKLYIEVTSNSGEIIPVLFFEDPEGNNLNYDINYFNNYGGSDGGFLLYLQSNLKNNISNIKLYYKNSDGSKILKKTIEGDKIVKPINKETSTGIYGLYEARHNSLNPINNILLSREFIFSTFKYLTDIVLTIDLSISGEDIGTVDNSKIYICKDKKNSYDEIVNSTDCTNYLYNNTISGYDLNSLYLYFVDGAFEKNFKNIKIDFVIKASGDGSYLW